MWQLWGLTGLVGGDDNSGVLSHLGCQRWHPVLRFNLKRVVSVSQQIGHRHCGVVEARSSWQEADVAPARLAALRPTVAAVTSDSTTPFAEDSEGDVLAPATVLRPGPLQDNRSLIDGWDHIAWSWRRTWWTEEKWGGVEKRRRGEGKKLEKEYMHTQH